MNVSTNSLDTNIKASNFASKTQDSSVRKLSFCKLISTLLLTTCKKDHEETSRSNIRNLYYRLDWTMLICSRVAGQEATRYALDFIPHYLMINRMLLRLRYDRLERTKWLHGVEETSVGIIGKRRKETHGTRGESNDCCSWTASSVASLYDQ